MKYKVQIKHSYHEFNCYFEKGEDAVKFAETFVDAFKRNEDDYEETKVAVVIEKGEDEDAGFISRITGTNSTT